MLEYSQAGSGARLAMLVLHDDAAREYAYGPAQALPDTKVGTFTQGLYHDGNQHEERLEANLRVRTMSALGTKLPTSATIRPLSEVFRKVAERPWHPPRGDPERGAQG
jgi:hypothetical protein